MWSSACNMLAGVFDERGDCQEDATSAAPEHEVTMLHDCAACMLKDLRPRQRRLSRRGQAEHYPTAAEFP